MKTKNIKLLTVFTLLLMAGCTEDTLDEGRGQVPISLTATVECDSDAVYTRAGTGVLNSFANGDAIKVYFPSDVRVGSTTSASSTTYSYNGSSWSPATQPYFNAGTSSCTVHAYYPSSHTNSTSSFSVQQDQSGDANYKSSDLMYATTNITKSNPSGSLTFAHRMAKIIVNATAGAGVRTITDVRIIGGYCTINISTPLSCTLGTTLSNALSTSSYITMYSGGSSGSASCAAMIPPQSISGSLLQVVTNQGTATYSLPSSKSFESGKSYQLDLTVNATAVGTTTTITGWTESGSVTVNPPVNFIKHVTPPVGALSGLYSVSASKQVFFSQGNLQATYNGSSWTWSFATNQWDYIGAGNTSVTDSSPFISGTGTVDMFGWVGASSTWTDVNKYGITSSSTGYGSNTTDVLKSDWGVLPISNGGNTANSGWRMLTMDEWTYLFNIRSTSSGVRYARAMVSGVNGIILLPDNWSTSYYSLTSTNTPDVDYTANSISSSSWNVNFAPNGAVFLPAGGMRYNSTVSSNGSNAYYWSSTPSTMSATLAHCVIINSNNLILTHDDRRYGCLVRLVYPVSAPVSLDRATPSEVGKVICSNGHIHNNVSDVTCGGTASAMIAYVGNLNGPTGTSAYSSTLNHGLAIALADVVNTSGDKQTASSHSNRLTWANASTACGAYKGAKPSGVTWQLPTAYQWELMLIGCGSSAGFISSESSFSTSSNSFGYGNFRSKLTSCGNNSQGVYDVQSGNYWSATERSAYPSSAWAYGFSNSRFIDIGKTYNHYVRPCFAF